MREIIKKKDMDMDMDRTCLHFHGACFCLFNVVYWYAWRLISVVFYL
jgi:hypothetical protein